MDLLLFLFFYWIVFGIVLSCVVVFFFCILLCFVFLGVLKVATIHYFARVCVRMCLFVCLLWLGVIVEMVERWTCGVLQSEATGVGFGNWDLGMLGDEDGVYSVVESDGAKITSRR